MDSSGTGFRFPVTVSVIIPIYNCQDFIEECLNSIFDQELSQPECKLELSIYEDGSTDKTLPIMENLLRRRMGGEEANSSNHFSVVMSKNSTGSPHGVGYGRNRAIEQSSGEYLCFCDGDDTMEPTRVITQLRLALENKNAIVGSRFKRVPEDSTHNFTFWANNLTDDQVAKQIFLTFGPTLVMPTWFCHRSVYDKIPNGFDESGRGTPEDLLFFYRHLDEGGHLLRASQILMTYRYHQNATTFSVSDETIWKIRLERLESVILQKWDRFTIWNAGKSGRRLYRGLKEFTRKKVRAFCDVDVRKLKQRFYEPYPLKEKVQIVSIQDAQPPFVICVKTEFIWDKNGPFRILLDGMPLTEGKDFVYFN